MKLPSVHFLWLYTDDVDLWLVQWRHLRFVAKSSVGLRALLRPLRRRHEFCRRRQVNLSSSSRFRGATPRYYWPISEFVKWRWYLLEPKRRRHPDGDVLWRRDYFLRAKGKWKRTRIHWTLNSELWTLNSYTASFLTHIPLLTAMEAATRADPYASL